MRRIFSPSQALLLCLFLAGILFLLDLRTPLGIADGILYVSVVVVSFWLPFPRGTILAASACTGLIILGFVLSPSGGEFYGIANRTLALATIWATATMAMSRGAALLEAENRYRDLVGSVPAIVCRKDSKTFRCTFVSPQAETILGYPIRCWTEEATFWQDHVVSEDRERVLASYKDAPRKGACHQVDYRMVAADGRIVWLRDYVTVIMQDGESKESIGVMVDVTEQLLTAEAVRHSEERYRALVEVSPDAIFINRDDRIVFINDRGLRLLRATSSDQVIGHTAREFFHPDFHEVIRQRIGRIMESGLPAELLEEQVVCVDGSVVEVEVDAARIIDAGMPAIQVVLRDITARRLAEHKQKVLIDTLAQRVKELTLLQQVTGLFQDHEKAGDEIIRETVSLLPFGWQFPDICAARIIVDSATYASRTFRESAWMLREDLAFCGEIRGRIEVVYLEKPATGVEGPFQDEERNLLKAVAKQCALYLENRHTRAALGQSEARFRESAERTRLMMDALPVLVAYVDREHRYQQNNEGYRRWFGEDPASLQGRHLRDVMGAPAYETIKPNVEAALRGEPVEFESEVPYAQGGARTVHAAYVPHVDGTGEVRGFYALVQDVSASKLAEEALKGSEDRLRKIVSVLAEGVMLQDSMGVILSCNPSAEQILGLSAEELIGRASDEPRWQAMHEDGSPFLGEQHPVRHTLRTGASCSNVIMGLERPDGALIWISINTKPLFRQGEPLPYGVVSSFQDITRRKEAEAALQDLLDKLELRVTERTVELRKANAALVEEMAQRRDMETILRRSESGLAEAQRIAHIGSWELDLVHGTLTWSHEIYRMFEMDADTFPMTYEVFLAMIHPEDRDLVDQAFRWSLQSHQPYEIVHRLLMKDGRVKFVHERGETSYDDQGKPLCTIGTVQDITERKLADEVLARSHRLLQTIIHTVPVRVFWKDRESRFLGCNQQFARDAGESSPLDIIGKDDFQLGWREQAELYRADDRAIIESGVPKLAFEEPQTAPDGSRIWLRTSKVPLLDETNQIIGVLGIYEDFTTHKRAEESLIALQAELEERVRKRTSELTTANSQLAAEIRERAKAEQTLQRRDAILQAVSYAAKQFLLTASWGSQLPDVLCRLGEAALVDHACVFQNIQDKDGDLRMSLKAEWAHPGIPSRLNDTRLQDVSYHEQGLERWVRDLSHGMPITGLTADLPETERAIMRIRGQRSFAMVPIFVGENWWGIMVFGIIRDDHSWQPAELEALQVAASTLGAAMQRERMEEQIRLYTEELEELVSRRTQRVTELETQKAQAEKLAALGQLAAGVAHEINNPIAGIKNAFLVLKDGIPHTHPYYHFVGMIEREIERVAGIVRRMYDLYRNESQQERVVALDTLMEDIAYLLKPKLLQRKVTLQSHIAPAIPPFGLVQRDLSQVLLNLIQNAIEASPQNGTVDIAVTRDRNHVRISVSDQGCGISPDELPHIFEPFFSGPRKRKEGGIGLGLSVSYSLVHAMGGEIGVVSQPNQGATFTVVLPLAHQPHPTAYLEGETR